MRVLEWPRREKVRTQLKCFTDLRFLSVADRSSTEIVGQ